MTDILSEVRIQVTPKEDEVGERDKQAEDIMKQVKEEIKDVKGIIGAEFGGSYAKGTWLAGAGEDIDIFIKFENGVPPDRLEDIARKVGFAALKDHEPYVKYSDHPYVEAVIGPTKVNLVPMYVVGKGEWKSSADRSQFHTEFMKKALTEEKRTEVRLLKTFLKCGDMYGAEIEVQGFSGYLAEVLICEYGSFDSVMKAMAKVQPGQVIGKASKEFDTPITITDPIDPNRNLMAAVSDENLGRFILACREYCKKPSAGFFEKRQMRPNEALIENMVTVNFGVRFRSPDILWGQLKRASAMIAKQLESEGFTVIRHGAGTDEKSEAALVFLLESITIPEYRVDTGPEFFIDEAAGRFIEKNSKTAEIMWVEGSRINVFEKRRYTSAQSFLKDITTEKLQTSGISKGLQDDIRGAEICVGKLPANESIKKVAVRLLSTNATVFSSG